MPVAGLDLSLTATGIVTGESHHLIKTQLRGIERITNIAARTLEAICTCDLVMIEGYSFGSANSHAHALGELGGVIRWQLTQSNINYIDVPPATLKLFATGKGNAGKDAVVASAARLGCPHDDNNLVDAWWLRQIGLYPDATDIPTTDYRDRAIAKMSVAGAAS